jgi:large subunit ribosomal protein L35
MPKQKTHKGVKKRVKVSANGKARHKPTGTGHLMSTMSSKRKRRLSKTKTIEGRPGVKALELLRAS